MSELDRLGCGMDYTWIIILVVLFFLLMGFGGTGCNNLQNIFSDFKCCFSGCGSQYWIWILLLFVFFYYNGSFFC